MQRKILIALLSLGAIGGLLIAGYTHRHYHADGRHQAFKQKVADICTESAIRVYDQRAAKRPK